MRKIIKLLSYVFLAAMLLQGQTYAAKAECTMDGPHWSDPKPEKVAGGYNVKMTVSATIIHSNGTKHKYSESLEKFLTEEEYNDPQMNEILTADAEFLYQNFLLKMQKILEECNSQN